MNNKFADELLRSAAQIRNEGIENAHLHASTLEAVAGLITKAKIVRTEAAPAKASDDFARGTATPITGIGATGGGETRGTSSPDCGSACIAPAPARTLTDHKVNGLNDAIRITPIGAPGAGGAHTRYILELDCPEDNAPLPRKSLDIQFQSRPIQTSRDFDGWTNEALIAIVIDRMRGFQGLPPIGGPMPEMRSRTACRENACALTHFEEGLMWLQKRTRDRMARGVEGTHAP